MKTETEIFTEQAELLQQAVPIINQRIDYLNSCGKINISEREDVSEKETGLALRIFLVRSLKMYGGILTFLAKEILIEEPGRAFFLLPHVRTLLDIYSRFIHLLLNCSSTSEKAMVCIVYQLYTYRNIEKEEYKKGLETYKDFLRKFLPDLLRDQAELNFSWIVDKGLNFKKRSSLLTEENIKKFSVSALEVFGTKKTYEIYSHLSELLHGNPYLFNGKELNERFWVIALSLVNTAFMLDMIDRYILDKGVSSDTRKWLKKVKRSRTEFTELWVKRRGSSL